MHPTHQDIAIKKLIVQQAIPGDLSKYMQA